MWERGKHSRGRRMKPGPNDAKLAILITGDERHELKGFTIDMIEAFGLDRPLPPP